MGCGGGAGGICWQRGEGRGAPGISHLPVPPGQGRIWQRFSRATPAIPLLAPLRRARGRVGQAQGPPSPLVSLLGSLWCRGVGGVWCGVMEPGPSRVGASRCREVPWGASRAVALTVLPGFVAQAGPAGKDREILGARGPGATLFSPSSPLDDGILFLHPVPILQSELALGPLSALHPVTPRTSPPCWGRARSPERAGRDGAGHGHQQPPRELGLRAGGLPWCKSGQDAAGSAGSPLGNGCHFLSIAVPHLPAPSILPHTSAAPGPRGHPAVRQLRGLEQGHRAGHSHARRAEEGKNSHQSVEHPS